MRYRRIPCGSSSSLVARIVRVQDGQAADGIVADHEGDVDDQLQATVQRRVERVGTEVGVALRALVEPLSEREEPRR